ncbi:MAG TPA: c-type cytochrome [Nitrospiria bacterium]|nr:c-type cytochrome [Nitrospiria bacterium]
MEHHPAARQIALIGALLVGVPVALTLMGADLTMPREKNIHLPRVPANQLDAVKKMVNPVPDTPETLEKGKALYTMACVACHGADGRGDGPLTKKTTINPAPRNFTNPDFQRLRTDGELFWVLKNGSHGTEMMRMDFFFTDQELWTLIRYIRSFGPRPGAPSQ